MSSVTAFAQTHADVSEILRLVNRDLKARPSNCKEFNARIFSRVVKRVHHARFSLRHFR